MKPLYVLLGVGSLTVGVIGIFLPLIPTTGPLLIAAFAFGRSSERLHRWLTHHPRFGPFIIDFQEGRGIPHRTKTTALVAMSAAFGYSIGWVMPNLYLKAGLAAVAVWALWYVAHFPTSDGR